MNFPTPSGRRAAFAIVPLLMLGASIHCSKSSSPAAATPGTPAATVKPAAPSGLSYAPASAIGYVGVAYTLTPTITGTVTSYAISPALPAGLSIDPTSGIISGTPTATSAQTTYTVTATNSGGSTTALLEITIDPAPTVYVGGYIQGASGNVATIWTNGTATSLPSSQAITSGAAVYGMASSGSNLYAIGSTTLQADGPTDFPNVGMNWLNDVLSPQLSPAPAASQAPIGSNCIAASGTDVYIAGASASGATIWKNGTPITPIANASTATLTAITVSGTDVYVAGSNSGNAMIWKNGTALAPLANGSGAILNAITVSGTDVYAAGSGGGSVAFWKNGTLTPLPTIQSNVAAAFAIAVSGKNVYVAGTDANQAAVWINNVETPLTSLAGNAFGEVNGIAVSGGTVYLVGYSGNEAAPGLDFATVWQGPAFTPTTLSNANSMANAIVVVTN